MHCYTGNPSKLPYIVATPGKCTRFHVMPLECGKSAIPQDLHPLHVTESANGSNMIIQISIYIIYIYMVTPPPMIHLQAFYMGITSVLCTFFLPEKWHSHVSISFTYYVSCRPRHTHMQFCFCLLFCHFLRFWSKTQKTLRKPKKQKKQNCKTHVGTSWWVRVCNFVFFVFFGFLEVFNTFGQKPKKTLRKPKKTKKPKLQDPCR